METAGKFPSQNNTSNPTKGYKYEINRNHTSEKDRHHDRGQGGAFAIHAAPEEKRTQRSRFQDRGDGQARPVIARAVCKA
jgi:hypothetical protein